MPSLDSRSSSSFPALAFPSIARRISQLFSVPVASLPKRTADFARFNAIDPATLESVYRLARLLTANESAAVDLVTETYRKAASADHIGCGDLDLQLQYLFADLYAVFQQNPQTQPCSKSVSDLAQLSSLHPVLVHEAIRRQDPIVRFMIFLRHCESFSLEEIAGITGQTADTVQIHLIEFRQNLQHLFRTKAVPDGGSRSISKTVLARMPKCEANL